MQGPRRDASPRCKTRSSDAVTARPPGSPQEVIAQIHRKSLERLLRRLKLRG